MALSSSQYETILRGYEKKRDDNHYLLEARRKKVYDTIPEYQALEESVGTQAAAAARSMLSGDDTALPLLKEKRSCKLAIMHLLEGYLRRFLSPKQLLRFAKVRLKCATA